MALWDSVSNFLSGGARGDAEDAYKNAQGYYDPYAQGGKEDYNSYRDYVQGQGQNLNQFGNAGNWQYGQINQSPVDYYNQIMGGYSESPQAKYEQQQSIKASNAAGAASGMLGSGAQAKALQQNAADISGRDQQRYFQNVGNTNQMQMGYLDNLNNRQDRYNQNMQYLNNLGYRGASDAAGNRINQGLSNAKYDQQAFDDIAGLVGAGGQNYKQNYQYNTTGGEGGSAMPTAQQIPWYLMFA